MGKNKRHYKMLKTTFVAVLLSLLLLFMTRLARDYQELEASFILAITASIIVAILLLGLNIFFRTAPKEKLDE